VTPFKGGAGDEEEEGLPRSISEIKGKSEGLPEFE